VPQRDDAPRDPQEIIDEQRREIDRLRDALRPNPRRHQLARRTRAAARRSRNWTLNFWPYLWPLTL